MIKIIDNKKMGTSNLGWLKSKFHFSFADYYNPNNINFGVLRVVNDDLIAAHTGFGTHPHNDMEIISYVLEGELTHEDSMGNKIVTKRGEGQYMSAGTGVSHSEKNVSDETLRILQIWILPDKRGYSPNYGEFFTTEKERKNNWVKIVSNENGNGKAKIHQDVNFYVAEIDANEELEFNIENSRQAYVIQIEGESIINEKLMNQRDAAEVIAENIIVKAKSKSHMMIIEMKKGNN